MSFLQDLEKELKPKINEILQHPYLLRLINKELTKEELGFFAKEYGFYCMYFPRFLAAIAANVNSDIERMSLVENLWEEHGAGDLKKSHRKLFFDFANSLGVSEEDILNSVPLISTTICVENLMYLCRNAHYVESMGALGLGTEYFTTDEYTLLLNGFKSYDFLEEKDLEFWAVHIGLDDRHYFDMMKNIEPYLDDKKYQFMLKQGAERAIELELIFWDGLEEHFLEI